MRRTMSLLSLLGLLLLAALPAARAEIPVDLELVLAVDVSGSIDPEEAALQRSGYVSAFRNPKVKAAILSGAFGRIAISYVEWAGDLYQRTSIGWTLLDSARQIDTFADRLDALGFHSAQWTAIGAAIDHSARLFDGSGFQGTRRVIDVSGDGVNNRGRAVQAARDEAVAAGIVINGLPILNDRPNPWGGAPTRNLDAYYRENVIGGPGSFIVPALGFEAFADAILAKLLLEIAGAPAAVRYAGQ